MVNTLRVDSAMMAQKLHKKAGDLEKEKEEDFSI